MDTAALNALEALSRPKGFIYRDEIPAEHYDAFWTFTGAQTMIKSPDGRYAIPDSAWSEYVTWLREEGTAPGDATPTTKFEWRRRTGRWI